MYPFLPLLSKLRSPRGFRDSSRGSFIITQKENKGEYGEKECWSGGCAIYPEWIWNETDIYAHAFDQTNTSGIPYRYISATNFGNNVCTGDYDDSNTLLTRAKGLYGNNNQKISNQVSCKANTLNAGNWYNYPATTAGSDMSSEPRYPSDAKNSICPKGWQLPPGSGDKSYYMLIHDAYNITVDNSDSQILASPLSFARLSYYIPDQGNLYVRALNGYYWSSAAHNATSSNGLYFTSALLIQDRYNNNYGFSLRCVSR